MLEYGGHRLRLHVNAQARPSSILEAAVRAFGLAGGGEGYGLSRVDGTTLPASRLLGSSPRALPLARPPTPAAAPSR